MPRTLSVISRSFQNLSFEEKQTLSKKTSAHILFHYAPGPGIMQLRGEGTSARGCFLYFSSNPRKVLYSLKF